MKKKKTLHSKISFKREVSSNFLDNWLSHNNPRRIWSFCCSNCATKFIGFICTYINNRLCTLVWYTVYYWPYKCLWTPFWSSSAWFRILYRDLLRSWDPEHNKPLWCPQPDFSSDIMTLLSVKFATKISFLHHNKCLGNISKKFDV